MADGPDQGFAWVVAFACFFINFIMAGLARTAGVLFVALINLYGVSREAATTPFSIRVCVRNMTGPLVGLLGQKYGIRPITMIGGAVAALGSILCYFAPNILWITMFWGAIHGFGFGLSTGLHMMVVGQYFNKYKASALGLGYSGDCVGTFAFPAIMESLLSTYGVRGTFLILGGMILNVIPMALLLRKPSWIKHGKKIKQAEDNLDCKSIDLARTNNKRIDMVQSNRSNLRLDQLDKASQTSLESLNTITDSVSLRTLKLDTPPIYENVCNGKEFPFAKHRLTGQCNPAFLSSDSDISSLNDPIEIRISNANNLKNSSSTQELKGSSIGQPQAGDLSQNRNKSFQFLSPPNMCPSNSSMNYCKSSKNNSLQSALEIRKIRSVSDLNLKNECLSPLSRSPWLNRVRNTDVRRDSLPMVLERDTSIKNRGKMVKKECEEADDMEAPRVDSAYSMRKRTSSFVGNVAQEIVNRMRTASFVSQVASDAFCTPIPQEPESDSDQEMECELKSIVEHKGHDIEHCTKNRDLVLSVDRDMMDEYLKDTVDKPAVKIEDKPKPPSVLKIMLRTNMKPMFILISISMAVYAFLFVGVLTIIIDYAEDLEICEDRGKYLIIGFSVADLFGRLTFGLVIDRNLMKMKNYSSCTMLIMGTVVAAIPLNTSFNYIMICMCMYGFVQGGTAIMFPILINMYMDKNQESVAMGCLNFYGGLLMLFMAPMIGYYRDNIGSYNCVFYIIGGVVAVVGIIWQFEPMIVKYQNKKLREKYIMEEMSMSMSQEYE